VCGLAAVTLAGLSCESSVTDQVPSTLSVEIAVGDSPFLSAGDTLVGDTVTFQVEVKDGGVVIPSSGYEFAVVSGSSVEIINASTGQAAFTDVGQSTVRVTVQDPDLGGSVTLRASMPVEVKQYDVELALVSTRTGADVDAATGLLDDTVQVVATVRKGTEVVASSDPAVTSSNQNVANPVTAGGDIVAYDAEGDATLTATFTSPQIPGPDPLAAGLPVTVSAFDVGIKLESMVPGSNHLANGDTLVTDSLVLQAGVVRAGDVLVKDTTATGTAWTSSRPAVIQIVQDTIARLLAADTATLFVSFTGLDLPGEPFPVPVRVSTYTTQVRLASLYTAQDPLADTLVTDSVQASTTVTSTKDGSTQPGTISLIASSDSTVISPVLNAIAEDVAVFADTGSAQLIVELADPTLPQATLQGIVDLQVSTYYVLADSVSSETPVMGDTVQYYASVWDTRPDPDTVLIDESLDFTSSNTRAVSLLDAATGRALARDTGSAEVSVSLIGPTLPNSLVADTFNALSVPEEFFYGVFSALSGNFRDTVVVRASVVHSFTDSTRVFFPNGTVALMDTSWTDSMRVIVGAGANSGELLLYNLLANGSEDRDSVPTRDTFLASGGIADPFEPNDTFPLTVADSFTVPSVAGVFFEEVLSIDPTKLDPIDNNFFWFTLSQNVTLNITAEWQQQANIDFYVCTGVNVPPQGLLGTPCQLEAFDTSTTGPETGSVAPGIGGPYVLRFWCEDSCPTVPLTYKVTIGR
jgi:hypothetical protein